MLAKFARLRARGDALVIVYLGTSYGRWPSSLWLAFAIRADGDTVLLTATAAARRLGTGGYLTIVPLSRPDVATIRSRRPGARIAYIMDGGGALPVALSPAVFPVPGFAEQGGMSELV